MAGWMLGRDALRRPRTLVGYSSPRGARLKRVILHIGPHKTGTTSIQATLRFSAAYLRSVGVDYMPTGLGATEARIHGQHNLGWESSRDRRHDPARPGWREAVHHLNTTDDKHSVISSEAFSKCDLDGVHTAAHHLKGCEVTIVYVLRGHLDWANSMFSQLAATWCPFLVERWVVEYPQRQSEVPWLHAPRLRPWIEVFGRQRVKVKVYENYRGNILAALLEEIDAGIDTEQLTTATMNQARTFEQLCLNHSICKALDGHIAPATYEREIAPLFTQASARLGTGGRSRGSRSFYLSPEALDIVRPMMERDLVELRGLGISLPEAYIDLAARKHDRIECLPEGIARLIAINMVSARIETLQLKARLRVNSGDSLLDRIAELERVATSMANAPSRVA
jgi:hypothetical protein